MSSRNESTTRRLSKLVFFVVAVVSVMGLVGSAWAQAGPFASSKFGPPVPIGGVTGWLFAKQAEFYRQFSGLIRAAKADDSALWGLMGVSFLYGVFHAAGPGHGKVVIASYLVANKETWLRGVVLSLASSLLQALVAVALVGLAASVLNVRASTMNSTVNAIETISYVLIVAIGIRLLWVKGRAFAGSVLGLHGRMNNTDIVTDPKGVPSDHGCNCLDHQSVGAFKCHADGEHDDAHCRDDHASAWGHAHAPAPEQLSGAGGWRRGLTAVVAVGLRPCSGAILVLVFALAQGLFWAGAASAMVMGLGTFATVAGIATIAVAGRATAARLVSRRAGYGAVAVRGIEVAAAAAVTIFGALLLCGYIINERMVGF